ncbi:helix-turn-helix domain-containing protein [Brucella microti]|nr:helix-turn-helix transcriptional regulator [Brucella microti]
MNAEQIRAARALLNWSQGDLVKASKLSLTTIRRMEDGAIGPQRSSVGNVEAVQRALESAGVTFIDAGAPSAGGGVGVRLTDVAVK